MKIESLKEQIVEIMSNGKIYNFSKALTLYTLQKNTHIVNDVHEGVHYEAAVDDMSTYLAKKIVELFSDHPGHASSLGIFEPILIEGVPYPSIIDVIFFCANVKLTAEKLNDFRHHRRISADSVLPFYLHNTGLRSFIESQIGIGLIEQVYGVAIGIGNLAIMGDELDAISLKPEEICDRAIDRLLMYTSAYAVIELHNKGITSPDAQKEEW